jgi:hypothetical protein
MSTALCATSTLAQNSPKPDPWKQAGADDGLRKAFEEAVYALKDSGNGTWTGTNDAQRLSMEFDAHEARLKHPEGNVAFHLSGYGYGDKLITPAAPKLAGDGTRLEYRRGDFTEWYVNGRQGLEQGFTLAQRPTGASNGLPLTIALSVTGDLALSQQDGTVLLKSGKSTVLRYGGLSARDALGHAIAAHMEARNNEIRLVVDDRQAQYPLTVDPTWTQQQKLTASDGTNGDGFGGSVAISGTTAVIGASGAAYVFVQNGSTWTQQQKLTASDGDGSFGYPVAVSGTTAVIGASDAAYIFVQSGSTWTQQQKLTGGDSFGWSIAVSGTTVVIGAPNQEVGSNPTQGAAYVFVQSGNTWTQQQELTASDGVNDDFFGWSVAVSGTTAVIGSPNHGFLGYATGQGAAYVFTQSGSMWNQQWVLIASDGCCVDSFGIAVAVSGTTAVIGSDINTAYIFVQNGNTWAQQQELNDNIDDFFGSAVAVSGTTAVIGATGLFSNPSAVYVFVQSNNTWILQQELYSGDTNNPLGGGAVAVSGAAALVGATSSAYIFVQSPLVAYLTSPAPNSILPSSSVEFKWPAVSGASAYDLHLSAVGPGGADIYSSGHITGTSTTANDVPINGGGPIYARLYTIVDGVTRYNDSTYKPLSKSFAQIYYPAPGSVLSSASETFWWLPLNYAWAYDLHLSAVAPGGYDLYASGHITSASATVNNLPIKGEKIYARLYTIADGVTYYNDFTYTATTQILSPTPGATFGSTSVKFTWSAASAASAYDLHLSAIALGGYDIYSSGHITGTSTTVNNLPINGEKIYARLYTIFDGVTHYTDYTYFAMSATLAQMTYPPPGSTLATSTVWFDWTPGTGVTQYDLHLSAVAPGGSDIYASGPITGTFKTVFFLPLLEETIYARLYSIIDGEKQYIDYTYQTQ